MNDAWNYPGWTAQQPFPTEPIPPVVTLPPNFTEVTVTARYVDDRGKALNGSMVRFTPSVQRVADGDTVVWLRKVEERIEKGILTVKLLATDVSGVIPGFHWHVHECFPGGEEYDILVPAASESPISLFALPRAIAS
jgi:pyruvate/2-oxoglutarate dehydrogenase complex dihydrolipoamide dehydrogenase (E3) component